MKCWWHVLAFVPSALLLAQTAPRPEPSHWTRAATAGSLENDVREALAALPPERTGTYLREVGAAFFAGLPACGDTTTRRLCVTAHGAAVASWASTEPEVAAWFQMAAAEWLIVDGDYEGALHALAEAERLALVPLAFERRMRRIDCLLALDSLALADREAAAALGVATSDEQRMRLVAKRGSIDVALGRLDNASRRLAEAESLLQRLGNRPRPADGATNPEFELLLRHVDLDVARERPEEARARMAKYVQSLSAAGRDLREDERLALEVHDAACAYVDLQHGTGDLVATITRFEALQQTPALAPHHRELLAVWRADLELRRERPDAAATILRSVRPPASGRSQWLRAPIETEIVRRRRSDDAALAAAEERLHRVLLEMVGEWRDVARDRETTGFLRLGTRLRVVGERIAIAIARGRPQAALDDLLEVQRCTTVSRTRDAPSSTVAELQRTLCTERSGVLVFVPAWNESHVFALDRERLVHAALPRASVLRDRVVRLQRELGGLDTADAGEAPALDDLRDASRSLGETLLPPAIRTVVATWHEVTITGRSLLGGVPFECIEWEPDVLLGERFAVTTTASLPLSVLLQRECTARELRPTFDVSLFATLRPEARFAQRNGVDPSPVPLDEWVARLLDGTGHGSRCRIGDDATVAAFAENAGNEPPDVTVLLAHGEPPIGERPPALGLAPDPEHPEGLLTPDAILATPRRGVVLVAACETARGPTRMGDDDTAATLAGAFLTAGATAVVASGAPLRARLQIDITASTLADLTAGHTLAEALRRARVKCGQRSRAAAWRAGQVSVFGYGASALAAAPAASRWLPWWLLGGALLLVTGSVGWNLALGSRRAATGRHSAAGAAEG